MMNMDVSDRDKYLIERHLRSELSDTEITEFDIRKSNAEFQTELGFQSDLYDAVMAVERGKLKQRLVALDRKESVHAKRYRLRNMFAAASIVLLIVFALASLLTKNDSSTERLFAEYFETPPNIIAPVLKSEGEATSVHDQAFRLYETGDYDRADQAFESLEKDENVQFFLSMCKMNLGKWREAKSELTSIYSAGGEYAKNAQWYLALIEVRLGNAEIARLELSQIAVSEGHPYRMEAKKLLQSLDGL